MTTTYPSGSGGVVSINGLAVGDGIQQLLAQHLQSARPHTHTCYKPNNGQHAQQGHTRCTALLVYGGRSSVKKQVCPTGSHMSGGDLASLLSLCFFVNPAALSGNRERPHTNRRYMLRSCTTPSA